jgi:hypothetical protein
MVNGKFKSALRLSSILIMSKSKLPKSIRKYIRQEKARIRRLVFDVGEQQRLQDELLKRFLPKEGNSRDAKFPSDAAS